MNKLLLIIIGLFLLTSCGSSVTVYSWNELETLNFNLATQQNIDSQSVELENFVLRINLNAGLSDYVSSGGFKIKKKDILAQQQIDSIHIFSVSGFDDTLHLDTILNQVFMARYPSDTATLYLIEDFVQNFAQSTDSVESHFDLYLQQKPKIPLQQFTLKIFLNDGRTLVDTTRKVIFLD